jgi:hypothetical protein
MHRSRHKTPLISVKITTLGKYQSKSKKGRQIAKSIFKNLIANSNQNSNIVFNESLEQYLQKNLSGHCFIFNDKPKLLSLSKIQKGSFFACFIIIFLILCKTIF